MKKFILFTIIGLFTLLSFSQNNGITYQAVIYNPNAEQLPGYDDQLSPMVESDICLRFSIYGQGLEYEETVQTTTDKFGMVNIIIGNSDQTGGSASSVSDVDWDTGQKSMRVELNHRGDCVSFEEISYQAFSYVPFAYYAQNDNATAAIAENLNLILENQAASEASDDSLQAAIDANEQADLAESIAGDEADAVLQSNIDTAVANATEAITNNAIAIATTQADVDQNEADADSADATLQSNIDTAVANATDAITNNAIANATTQADVDQNEADSDSADATLQSNIDTAVANATDAITNNAVANATTQADVDANESDSDTADATLQANIDALQADVDGNEAVAITELNDLGDVLKESNSLYIGKDPSATTNNAQQNVSVGTTALGAITTGDKNTAVGFNALAKTAAGINNVSVGFSSLSKVTSGSYNVAVGNGAGSNVIGGSSSVFIGNNANTGNGQGAPSNRIAIGAAANVTQNNTAVIGNGNVTQIWMAEDKGAVVYAAGVNVDGTLLSATIAALQADVDQNESDSDSADTTMQADIDGNELDADAAIAAVQTDVDGNEADADAAIAALEASTVSNEGGTFSGSVVITGNLTVLGGTTSGDTAAAIESVQTDVDGNEADTDAAIAALQADVDGNEADSDTAEAANAAAIAALQTDVNGNESDADAAIAALQADVDGNEVTSDAAEAANAASIVALQADVDANEVTSDAAEAANTTAIAAVQTDVDTNEVDADAAIAAVQADVDANEAATVKLTGNQTVNGVKTFNSDLLARLRGNVRTTNAAGTVSLVLNTNVGSDSPAVFTGNVVGDVSGAVGTGSGLSIFSEWNSIYIGSDPSSTTVTNATPGAKNNLSLGKLTLSTVTTGDKNTAIGLAALKVLTTGYNNNAIGYQAGNKLTTGFNNDMFGFQAGNKVTTGQENVLIGRQSGFNVTTGKWNVFVGKNAGSVIKTGQQNTMIGNGANVPSLNTGAVNRTAIGFGAIASTNNTVVLGNTNAANELWVGTDKQGDVFATDGTFTGTITGNVTGDLTGNADTATALSTAIGLNDLSDVSVSSSYANMVISPANALGGGYTTDLLDSYYYVNVNHLGAGITYSGGYDHAVVLGNSYTTSILGGQDRGATFRGGGFVQYSDRRLKTNIQPLGSTLSSLSKLEGKKYFNTKTNINDIGLIAQDILKYFPELVSQDDPSTFKADRPSDLENYYMVNYDGFVPILVNAINEQQVIIQELQSKVDEIDELKEELENLKQLIMNNN
ncbi:tail fiber domain-containing protein [Flavobacteriaceae bacterium]|nr:tail fiber domain-containing protein [Flavobacteriaceae bacterium]